MEKSLMYCLRKLLIYTLALSALGCEESPSKKSLTLNELEKDSLTNQYDEISNYFLQPSQMHRIYKDSALMIQPENVDIRQRFSYSYKKVGEHIKAMEVLNKAVEIDISKGKVDALQYRAWTLLYYYRDYEGAISDVELIEKMTGSSYNSCWGEPCGFLKGQAQYKLGDYMAAIESFNIVNQEEERLGFDIKDNHFIFFYLGRCYALMGKYDEAISFYKKSLTSVAKFPEAYYQIGLAYKSKNNKALANQNFKLAKEFLDYSMDEPFVERFDEVFSYMIERELKSLNKGVLN